MYSVRSIHKLSDVKVKALKDRGRISDGGGLYLNVSTTGSKSWVFMWTPRGGKRREMGLGSYPAVSLSSARNKAAQMRAAIEDGRNPLEEQRAARAAEKPKTFGEAADLYIASAAPGWRNTKHASQWEMTLSDAYCSAIRSKAVSDISREDVLGVLTPIWTKKAETASRLRSRIERVLNFARVKGWRPAGENPAAWRGNLENTLPRRQKLQHGHHSAMNYRDVSEFVAKLRGLEAMAARALELLILCASRSGEVIGAKWDEVDLEASSWTIPATRMKAGQEHVVPLSDQARALLVRMQEARTGEFVFPGERPKRPLSAAALTMLMRRHDLGQFTIHGFRSSFRDWCGDETSFAREVAEQALAHKVGDSVERAYRRGTALEKRRELMQAWADYLDGKAGGKVVRLEEARQRA